MIDQAKVTQIHAELIEAMAEPGPVLSCPYRDPAKGKAWQGAMLSGFERKRDELRMIDPTDHVQLRRWLADDNNDLVHVNSQWKHSETRWCRLASNLYDIFQADFRVRENARLGFCMLAHRSHFA